MLLLPEGQTGETWELTEEHGCFRNWGALDRKILSSFFNGRTCAYILVVSGLTGSSGDFGSMSPFHTCTAAVLYK
jgi:hypothetical protein